MSRLPLPLRLTLAFAAVLAFAFAVTGSLIYLSFRADLNESEDAALLSRSEEVSALVRRAGAHSVLSLSSVSSTEDDFAQVLSSTGALLAATPQVPARPVLTLPQVRRALRKPITIERAPLPELDGRVRVHAASVSTPFGTVLVAAGTALGQRDETLSSVALRLEVGGLAALLLASLAGYGLARSALRPVEAMRRQAAAIIPGEPGPRLPRPLAEDELARLSDTLNEMLERLQSAVLRERAFVADAGHELRTPLSILRAELGLALSRERTPDQLRAAIESAAHETDRLARLADDLLLTARLDQGKLRLRLEQIDLPDLLGTVAARATSPAQARGITIEIGTAELPPFSGDRLRLEQALGNMLDNAVRHARMRVSLDAEARAGAIALHIRDDGPGFEPGLIGHAFERFTRGRRAGYSEGAGDSDGAGLGLAIVQAIAFSHRGHAGACNLPGGGADVWIELPLVIAGPSQGGAVPDGAGRSADPNAGAPRAV